LWRVSDSTIRINVARGGRGGVGWRAKPPPCGQLTRCFSAVAELLVVSCYTVLNLSNHNSLVKEPLVQQKYKFVQAQLIKQNKFVATLTVTFSTKFICASQNNINSLFTILIDFLIIFTLLRGVFQSVGLAIAASTFCADTNCYLHAHSAYTASSTNQKELEKEM